METTHLLPSGARLTSFALPESARAGVLILPGGGYGHLAIEHEGHDIAAWLNQRGFAAWMLEYHINSTGQTAPLHPAPLNDCLEALAHIRAHASSTKLGVWGFSAGGHLAATLATEPNANLDFAILAYPVISLEPEVAHGGSRRNLLGENFDLELSKSLSAHNRVSPQTPPTFLFHTGDDAAVPVENSLLFYAALRKHGVPGELHVYETGRHGVGLAPDDSVLSTWPTLLETWLQTRIA